MELTLQTIKRYAQKSGRSVNFLTDGRIVTFQVQGTNLITHNAETLAETIRGHEWAQGENRIDAIGQNGPTGEHYDEVIQLCDCDGCTDGETWTEVVIKADQDPDYKSLAVVLARAYDQAASGKGAERHGQDLPFDDQPMQKLISLYGQGFALGQAAKKAQESMRLPRDRAVAELLGAINYLAGAVIHLENQPDA